MPILSRDLRRLLEKTIAGENGARQIAEEGAERSLQRLAVDKHEPHTSLTPEDRTLRNELRAHGRQLGDKRDPQRGSQTIKHLKQAVAYEHWHRMLFARYLAENDLLLHPEHGVALSLDEVKELALSQQRDWIELAADFAQRMLLSAVFRSDDPALRVPLPPEKRLELERKLDSLPSEIFHADDSLGWVYQFWQKDAKDAVNRSEDKIGADELPPVTQLFTEDYMVLFLLQNTLGAWWTAKRKAEDKSTALAGYEWNYLRLREDGMPAAGGFEGWPRAACDLRILDPCMGSGHFLTFSLPILVAFRMEEEGLSREQAVFAVLRDNLFGLEIDPRCTQIAAFNIALAAWRLVGHIRLPRLNLACSGLGINASEEDWVTLAGEDGHLRETMQTLFRLFQKAPLFGSLIEPKRAGGSLFAAEFDAAKPLLERALALEEANEATHELTVTAQGILDAARLLSQEFTLVATNVPYLGRPKQVDDLKEYCDRFHPAAKADLGACLVERCISFCSIGASSAVVCRQNWLFQDGYKELRKKLLLNITWNSVAKLGPRAFETITGEVVNVALVTLTAASPEAGHGLVGIDVSGCATPELKSVGLRHDSLVVVPQEDQLQNPDAIITLHRLGAEKLMSDVAFTAQGFATSDNPPFMRSFWEISKLANGWVFAQSAPEQTGLYEGRSDLLLWEDGRGSYYHHAMALKQAGRLGGWKSGVEAWGRKGILIAEMSNLPATLYTGDMFDHTAHVVVPIDQELLPALWCFCRSDEFRAQVRRVSQKLNVTNETLVKVPFDVAHWAQVAEQEYPAGLPRPHSDDPTQWLFEGFPRLQDALQVGMARLLGYRWPRQTGSSSLDCPSVPPDSLESFADEGGIVSLASIKGEAAAADRLRALFACAYGDGWGAGKISELLSAAGYSGRLEDWLRDKFFEQHCELFKQRPFVWHVWDGLRDGFHALVNYHRLDRENLEKLIYSYLGDWLTRQRQDVSNGVEGADTRLAAAEHLQGELERILEGKPPYDIFVRWKPVKEQPIGWEPDLNDGVRINIRPWITAAHLYRATKPGILRVQPNIKYTKDRGKEPAREPKEFPWFKGSADRVNDHHLTLEEKKCARDGL